MDDRRLVAGGVRALEARRGMKIDRFEGEFRFLSNFWPAEVRVGGVLYPSVEVAYVACKTLVPEERARVLACRTPGEAKRVGRTLTLRPGWDARPGQEPLKVEVMRRLLAVKFRAGGPLAEKLLATGEVELVEGNDWGDTEWGVCRGRGKNILGRLLMEQRALLRKGG